MSGGECDTSEHSPGYLSDDDEEDVINGINRTYSMQGHLNKWTNYIHGWQDRFFILKDGTLSYYKSEHDLSFGCRGSVSILKATIKPHEFDECRFDVSVNDCVWYLRASSLEDKRKWVDALELFKIESGYGSQASLKRYGSAGSVCSTTQSTASASSFRSKGRGLKVKLAELETYRDILLQQIEKLQKYFDAYSSVPVPYESTGLPCSLSNSFISEGLPEGLSSVDFRGEALTFKATTSGVLTSLSHCIEVMSQREEYWKKRVDREVEKRKKVEEYFKQTLKEAQEAVTKKMVIAGPDCEEGPHSALKEEEFFDAVEMGLDRLEEEEEFRDRLKEIKPIQSALPAKSHPLNPEIEKITMEQLHYARLGVGEGGWELFAEDGEMRLYKREEEVDGLVVDPLKAVHTVKGFTGREMCNLFYSADVRMEWEMTVDQMTVLETISEDTTIFLQIHKRIWPATQRDTVFWSHIRGVPHPENPDGPKIWIVCNKSTTHPKAPEKANSKLIRLYITVSLTCETIINPAKSLADLTRDDITCKIMYCSVVNPGGWAPASVLRSVYKREYPRFLKRFTQYVYEKCKNNPIQL